MIWSLSKQWNTRGNLPMGNLWLGGRSHTYWLWWIMGSPLDSCLTCQVEKFTQRSVSKHCTVMLTKSVFHKSKFLTTSAWRHLLKADAAPSSRHTFRRRLFDSVCVMQVICLVNISDNWILEVRQVATWSTMSPRTRVLLVYGCVGLFVFGNTATLWSGGAWPHTKSLQ